MQLNKPEMETKNMTTSQLGNSINRLLFRRRFLLLPLLSACFALSPPARAVVPAPAGGYFNDNTAEGEDALFSLTTGFGNTAVSFRALFNTTTGSRNTANGGFSLSFSTTGNDNTANGQSSLLSNTTGDANTSNGVRALQGNLTGFNNTATGVNALLS